MSVTIYHFLTLSMILFFIGAIGVLVRRNALIVLMSLELMLNAGNISLITFSRFYGKPDAQVAVFLIMAIAAAEVAIGLAVIVKIFRLKKTINIDLIRSLKK